VRETITTETRVIERGVPRPQVRHYNPPTYYTSQPVYIDGPVYVAPRARYVRRYPHYVTGPFGVFGYPTGGYTDVIYDR